MKRIISFRLIAFLAILCCGLMRAHSQEPVFEAFSEAEEILYGSYFEVHFTLRNADGTRFSPPDFEDFQVLSGPSRRASTTIVNGAVSKELTISYTLRPQKKGILTIGAASVVTRDGTLRTDPLKVRVLDGGAGKQADEDFFIKAELSDSTAYIGQQVRLDFKLYTTVTVQNYNILEEPVYDGCYAEELRRPDTRVRKEVLAGVEYTTKVLKSIALYPQQTGTVTVGESLMQLGILEEEDRRSSFFGGRIRRVPVSSEPVQFEVVLLPEGAPSTFSGAVGNYELNTSINRQEASTDDAISLRLSVVGDGDLKRIQAPDLNLPSTFELYEPRISEEETGEYQNRRIARKTFEYLLLPKRPGTYRIEPAFTFFSPDSNRFVRLESETYTVRITAGSMAGQEGTSTLEDTETARDIRSIKIDSRLRQPPTYWTQKAGFWVAAGLPVLLIGGMFLLRRRQEREAALPLKEHRKRQARKAALQLLASAREAKEQGQTGQFYDGVSKAMLGYISDKLEIPKSALDKNNLQEKLQSLQLPPERIQAFLDMLNRCEMALFAGKDEAAAMGTTYEAAVQLLADLHQRLK